MKFKKKLFDIDKKVFIDSEIEVLGDRIINISETSEKVDGYVFPGLIDSHVHIESSMLTPLGFSKFAIMHGVVSVVTDPHEITNVLGESGFEFMRECSKSSDLKIYFGVPSCVPATDFETSGAIIDSSIVAKLIKYDDVVCLSEMMNFPGVLNDNLEIFEKIRFAKNNNKPIDGHAPGLSGDLLQKYIDAGISTDHECESLEEALEKLAKGMLIQIREGSSAKNFNNLYPLIDEFPEQVMLCTDDIHPDDLENGYIDLLVRRSLSLGLKIENVLKAAVYTPITHYGLKDVGNLLIGSKADFIFVDDLESFRVTQTYIDGKLVYDSSIKFKFESDLKQINNFNAKKISESDIKFCNDNCSINVIELFDGKLFTDYFTYFVKSKDFCSDTDFDVLKIVVLNRYDLHSKPVIGFIKGFGLLTGAIASSVAHDSHNIIAVGVSDLDIVASINKIIDLKGGIVVSNGNQIDFLQLEVAGLMTNNNPYYVSSQYEKLNNLVLSMGSNLKSPFMTLSFMSLLVIPKLKIGDRGLFDITKVSFISLVI